MRLSLVILTTLACHVSAAVGHDRQPSTLRREDALKVQEHARYRSNASTRLSLPPILAACAHVAEDLHDLGRSTSHLSAAASLMEAYDQPASRISSGSRAGLVISLVALVIGLTASAPVKGAATNAATSPAVWKLPFFIVSWMGLSAGLTVFNKWVFMPGGGAFPHVATLTWCHMLVATVLSQVLRRVQPDLVPAVVGGQLKTWQLVKLVGPVVLMQPFTLVLGNTAYLYLSVSYIQMIKAAMPGMVFILAALVGLEKFSWQEGAMLFLLGVGVAGCSHGESQFSWIGLGFQMTSFFCEAFRLIGMKLMVSAGGSTPSLDPLSALFYVAPLNLMTLTGPMLMECRHIPFADIWELRFVLAANCLVAFSLNVAGVCLMSLGSAVTFAVCGLLKDFALIFGSTLIFGNILTAEQIFAAIVVLVVAVVFQQYQKIKNRK